FGRAIVDGGNLAAALEHGRVGAEPHGAAEVAVDAAPLQLVALHPFDHQPDDRVTGRPKFGRVCALDAAQITRRLDHGHLHAEADAEIWHLPLAREPGGADCTLGAALAGAAVDANAAD